jgi:hypothetical protein
MQLTNAQKHIFKIARDAFAHQTGIALELLKKTPGQQTLVLKTTGATAKLEVMVLEGWGGYFPLILLRRLQNLENYIMVVPQVTAERADELKKNGIQFIDTAGNGYINQPPLYLFIKGIKTQGVIKAPTVNRAFKQTGLRVLYALLCNPGLENETYRSIAAKTNVALGMVNWVVKDLNELGFLMETGTGRARQVRLIRKEQLLDRWITAYAEQLRPKLVLGRYRGAEGWWQQAVLNPEQALWGGEVAAAKLTDYLKPQTVTVYVDKDNPAAVLIPNRLKKDPEGDVELIGRFWRPDVIAPHGDTVHPILVYADLMATGNQRNIETARIIYDEHIVQLVGEN